MDFGNFVLAASTVENMDDGTDFFFWDWDEKAFWEEKAEIVEEEMKKTRKNVKIKPKNRFSFFDTANNDIGPSHLMNSDKGKSVNQIKPSKNKGESKRKGKNKRQRTKTDSTGEGAYSAGQFK